MHKAVDSDDWADRQDRLLTHSLVVIGRAFIRRYPLQLGLATLLLFLSGLMEGIGILMLLPILDILLGGAEASNHITEIYKQVFEYLSLPMTLSVTLIVAVGLVCAKNLLLFTAKLYSANIQAAIHRDFRLDMIHALMHARWQFFTGEPIGRLTNSILQETDYAATAARALMLITMISIQLLVYLATALLISWKLTVAAMVASVLIMWLLRIFVEMTRRQGARATALNRSYTSRIVDLLTGLKPLKAMALEDRVTPFLEQETEQLMTTQRKLNLATNSLSQLQEPITVVLVAVGVFIAVESFSVATPVLLVMVALFARTVGRISGLLQAFKKLARLEAPYFAFTSKLRAIEEEAEREAANGGAELSAAEFNTAIVFENVGFSYGENRILADLSLTIAAGQVTAIVGPSGAGKSTLLDLLTGLLRPQSGTITVDGVDLVRFDKRAWRRLIGYVPQDSALFHATIMDNLTLGDTDIGEATVIRALKDAGAWEFVAEMSEGLHSMVGERGLKISGGQRQRLAIARALVHRPRLLLLDEATSALDAETEKDFCETLRRLVPDVTIVAISHRPAIEEIADVSYQLDGGRITERQTATLRARLDDAVESA